MPLTEQDIAWSGDFGREYTDRSPGTPEDMDALYAREYGTTRSELNEKFLDRMPRDSRILEVGSNVGVQLELLQRMGFTDLWGVELQERAVDIARARTKGITFIQGSVFDIPFKDAWFDVVFTSGLLIHVSPENLPTAVSEIHRCTREYVWTMEYYSTEPASVVYRGRPGMLWTRNFGRAFTDAFQDLKRIRILRLPHILSAVEDQMCLLVKR